MSSSSASGGQTPRGPLGQAGQSMLGRSAGANPSETTNDEVARLRQEVHSLQSEREMRMKLEKLLEVQMVQVDLQKELRVKTESLLMVEQQTTQKLRQSAEQGKAGTPDTTEGRKQLESEKKAALEKIAALEKQLQEAGAPETSDRVESKLKQQVEEQERIIQRLTTQMGSSIPEDDAVRTRVQMQDRDQKIDELQMNIRKVQNEAAESASEAEVLKHQLRVIRKEVTERKDEMERQLQTERNLRAEVFQLQSQLETTAKAHTAESKRCTEYAQQAAKADQLEKNCRDLEDLLQNEKMNSQQGRSQLSQEFEYRMAAKEQVVKHQTTTIENLTTELKQKQSEIDKLMRSVAAPEDVGSVVLPPPQDEDERSQRTMESLYRQVKSKDQKIAKQTERLQNLSEMLEKRDQQLEELATARRDRENMKQQLLEMQQLLQAQPKVGSHAEAERRLIEMEQRSRATEGMSNQLEAELNQERAAKESLQREINALRGHVADGQSSGDASRSENQRLIRELAATQSQVQSQEAELHKLRTVQATYSAADIPASMLSGQALQKKLQAIERADPQLGREVALFLQEKEGKIEGLQSTVELLRRSIDDLRNQASSSAAPPAPAAPAPEMQTRDFPIPQTRDLPMGGQPLGGDLPGPVTVPVPQDVDGDIGQADFNPDMQFGGADEMQEELIQRRNDQMTLEAHLREQQQLVLRLTEEANLCNAEVASLQQTLQQTTKTARKKEKDFERLSEEKEECVRTIDQMQKAMSIKDEKMAKMFEDHQAETGGCVMVDEVERKVGWALKALSPRQHEIRNSVFLVLNRKSAGREDEDLADERMKLQQGIAAHLAIPVERVDVIEDARLPDSTAASNQNTQRAFPDDGSDASNEGPEGVTVPDRYQQATRLQGQEDAVTRRELILINLLDSYQDSTGQNVNATIGATDLLDHLRNDVLRGQSIGPLEGFEVDAVFINHGDMVLPFEFPKSHARLLLREGRVLAGKYAVLTVHEVKDPYILRIVAYDTEVGREFMLFLNTRDVLLLLDAHDSELSRNTGDGHPTNTMAHDFQMAFSVAESQLLDVVIKSLSFSVWQDLQILVASEMRIPDRMPKYSALMLSDAPISAMRPGSSTPYQMYSRPGSVMDSWRQQQPGVEPPPQAAATTDTELPPLTIPDHGVQRGLRPQQSSKKLLYEDIVCFEGRLCVFSVIHQTTPALNEDLLKVICYYPKTSASIEAHLTEPMTSDRLRIVAEAGQLDSEGPLNVVVVVEEIVYPPSFLVRMTSVSIEDAFLTSPAEESKPHSHIIRIAKDGSSTLHLPDISFAVSPSTIRAKLLRCIGQSTPMQAPREVQLQLPSVENVTGETMGNREVTGHVNKRDGLKVQINNNDRKIRAHDSHGKNAVAMEYSASVLPHNMRAQLREKFGKGRLLVRLGRTLPINHPMASKDPDVAPERVRVVVSVFERPKPYYHFVICAYEPQTSREWEVLADSIDLFRIFSDKAGIHTPGFHAHDSRPLDLANPQTQERLANILVNCVELAEREHELSLVIAPKAVREHLQSEKKKALRDSEPEKTGEDGDLGATTRDLDISNITQKDAIEVRPAITRVVQRSVGGFTDNRDSDQLVDQRVGDRLFVAQRRLATMGEEPGEPYKIQIYDLPMVATLHTYMVTATPVHGSPGTAAGLPMTENTPAVTAAKAKKSYSLKVDQKVLQDIISESQTDELLEPSRQEELLHLIFESLQLDEDMKGTMRLWLKKKSHMAMVHSHASKQGVQDSIVNTGAATVAVQSDGSPHVAGQNLREVGGTFPLNRISDVGPPPRGPSLHGDDGVVDVGSLFTRGWKKVYRMAQRFGSANIIITVSKRDLVYRLSVYEPESSSLYECTLATANATTPYKILLDHCDLAGKVDLVLCMHEVSFPHQVSVSVIHLQTSQEFNLKIGDDYVYAMIENSRREAFMVFFDQLLRWGCVGLENTPDVEDVVLPKAFDETYTGNQIFEKTVVEDVLKKHRAEVADENESAVSVTPAGTGAKKVRVPVIRTQLDFMGRRNRPLTGITMQLLYQAEHAFDGTNTLMFRVHKKAATNDVAFTLRMKGGNLNLPQLPGAANGRAFATPALGGAESAEHRPAEYTLWLQDKCSRAPCGAYGEICDVPGFDRPVLLIITDDDSPRAIRVAVCLATLPFTVIFQCVLLEVSEPSAVVQQSAHISASRRALQTIFVRYFGGKAPTSAVLSQMASAAVTNGERKIGDEKSERRRALEDLTHQEGVKKKVGVESGDGPGLPSEAATGSNEAVDTTVVHMCTRNKMGRMMVFTLYKDRIGQNLYLRLVMLDPVTRRESHLTILSYTTQRFLDHLRINRDLIEVNREELGKLVVDNCYLVKPAENVKDQEVLDHLEVPEDEDVEYEMRLRDVVDTTSSTDLTSKKKLLLSARTPKAVEGDAGTAPGVSRSLQRSASKDAPGHPGKSPMDASEHGEPKSLLEMSEDHLVHRDQKFVNGRRVLIAFYSETSKEDMINYSHNIRIQVADAQSLDILVVQDVHEDTIEPMLARIQKRHLMSATREKELVQEMSQLMTLLYSGQTITGVTFQPQTQD